MTRSGDGFSCLNMINRTIYHQSAALISSDDYSCDSHTSNSMADGGLINHNDSGKASIDVSSITWDSDIPTCQYVPNLSIRQTIDKSISIGSAAEYSSEHDDYTNFRLELDSHANMHVVGSGAYI
jgi:hypothetical protein